MSPKAMWLCAALALVGATAGCGGTTQGSDSTVPATDTGGIDSMVGGDAGRDSGGTDSGMMELAVTGAVCNEDDECAAASVTGDPECIPPVFGFPGGYCTNDACNPSLDDCPGDGVCEMVDNGTACLDACDPMAPDCRPGYRCFDAATVLGGPTRHYCLPLCENDMDCTMGQMCDDTGMDPSFTCFTPGADLGDACDELSDCGAGQFCLVEVAFGFPAGYCSDDCNPMDPNPCGAANVCAETDSPTEGLCLQGCVPGAGTCRTAYSCRDTFLDTMVPGDSCLPACTSDGDCSAAGFSCESIVGLCQPALDPAAFGGPCADDSDCVGGFCIAELDDGQPGGLCVDECDPAMVVPSDCPANGTCVTFGGIGFGICLEACDAMAPMCRAGYICESTIFPDVCVGDCSSSSQCDSACCEAMGGFNACVDPGAVPPPTCLP